MKRIAVFVAMVMLVMPVVGADSPHTFYVQLIRGTDTEQAPEAGWRHAGPKLAATFRPVFTWKSYWEVSLREAKLQPGQKARVRLSADREVEIDLRQPKERKITAYQNGKQTDQTIAPMGEHMTIIGGKRQANSSWFIVVRRDKPQD